MRDAIALRWRNRGRSGRDGISRRIDLIAEIHANRADGSGVAQTKTDGVRKIIEVGGGGGFPGERNVIHVAVDVAAVVEKRAAKTIADEGQAHREMQLLIEDQEGEAADRKARARIARAGFIEAESPQRLRAAGKEAFGQRNNLARRNGLAAIRGHVPCSRASRVFDSEARGTGEDEVAAKGMVGGVLDKGAQKASTGTKRSRSVAHVGGVEGAGFGIAGIVPAIASVGDAKSRHQSGLAIERNLIFGNRAVQVGGHHAAKKITVLERARRRKLLGDLELALVTYGSERGNVQRLIRKDGDRRAQRPLG